MQTSVLSSRPVYSWWTPQYAANGAIVTRRDRTTIARTRITAILAAAAVAASVVAIAVWSYLLVRDGYRAGLAGMFALTIMVTCGCLISTVKGAAAKRLGNNTARRRTAAILFGFSSLVGIFAIAIWLRDGYRAEIAGILALMVSLVFFCLGLVSQLTERGNVI